LKDELTNVPARVRVIHLSDNICWIQAGSHFEAELDMRRFLGLGVRAYVGGRRCYGVSVVRRFFIAVLWIV